MNLNKIGNLITSYWPFILMTGTVLLLLGTWLAEGGWAKLKKYIPFTFTRHDYKFFKSHGYWPEHTRHTNERKT